MSTRKKIYYAIIICLCLTGVFVTKGLKESFITIGEILLVVVLIAGIHLIGDYIDKVGRKKRHN